MTGMDNEFDVVIVGGGVIGSACAFFLHRSAKFRGTIAVVEPDPSYRRAASALSASSIQAFVDVFRGAENNLPDGMTNPPLRDMLNSTSIEHHKNRAILTASVPPQLIQKMISSPQDLGGLPNPAK